MSFWMIFGKVTIDIILTILKAYWHEPIQINKFIDFHQNTKHLVNKLACCRKLKLKLHLFTLFKCFCPIFVVVSVTLSQPLHSPAFLKWLSIQVTFQINNHLVNNDSSYKKFKLKLSCICSKNIKFWLIAKLLVTSFKESLKLLHVF